MNGFELQPTDAQTTVGVSQWGRFAPNDGSIISAFEPLENVTPSAVAIGFAYVFGKLYRQANPNELVLLIPAAELDTGFSDNSWNQGNPNYNDAVSRANAALAQTAGQFGGFLWHQGETDALAGISEVSHAASLDAMIAAMRTDITGATSAPFLIGEMAQQFVATDPGTRGPVQDAIQDTPNRVTNSALVSSTGLVVYDGIHFDDDSQRTFGQRYYDAYVVLVGA